MKLKKFLQRLSKNNVINTGEFDYFEEVLLESDFGPKLSAELLAKVREKRLKDSNKIKLFLREFLIGILTDTKMFFDSKKLNIMLFTGINGLGKTTSSAKIAGYLKDKYSMVFATEDTFRATALEQLLYHGNQLNIPVICKERNVDSASVGL